MVQSLPTGYVFNPADPRAPALDQWERMLPDERARVVAMLPATVPEAERLAEEFAGKLADTERQLAEARAEIERLRRGPT